MFGKVYPSKAAACRELGHTWAYIQRHYEVVECANYNLGGKPYKYIIRTKRY